MVEARHLRKIIRSSVAVHVSGSETHSSMVPPLLLLAALAAPSPPITVTGHQWAPFISPMGEPFRAHSPTDDTLARWFYQADANRDGFLTADEMIADADRFFAKLDTNHDGQIDTDEIAQYEYEVSPEIQVMSKTKSAPGQAAPVVKQDDELDPFADDSRSHDRRRNRAGDDYASLGLGGGLQGAARYSLLNMPEPVAAADTDFNRLITLQEFRQAAIVRFQLLDKGHQARISLAQLEAMPHAPTNDRHRRKIDENAPDARIGDPLPSGP